MTILDLLGIAALVVAFFLFAGTVLGYIDWRP